MKKNLIVFLAMFTISLLSWCGNGNQKVQEIDPSTRISQNWLSVYQEFQNQIWESPYISDFKDIVSLYFFNTAPETDVSLDEKVYAEFDNDSSIQWWITFSRQKYLQWKNNFSDILFNIEADDLKSDPFECSWEVSMLSLDWNDYLQIHDFNVFMWEGNIQAKIYSLLAQELKDKRIDLETASDNEQSSDEKMSINDSLINIFLFTWDNSDLQLFTSSLENILWIVNKYANLWISTEKLSLDSIDQIKYVEYKDSVIWKIFKWSLTANENKFNIDIDSSQKWFHIYLYNVSEFDEDVQEFEDREIEFDINLEKNKKSEYSISIQSSKSRQKTLDIVWKLS